jgi:KaiC/GvpD/RAD55 family RecA-like ATPase
MVNKIIIDSISDLLDAANERDVWILDGLIEEGDQVVLSGPPKAGKSLMVSQMALAVASGGSFLKWKAHTPP